MTSPLPTLDSSQLARAISLLDEEWLQHDPDLGPVMPLVLGRGVGQDWHKAGTFRHHLIGVTRTLTLCSSLNMCVCQYFCIACTETRMWI